MKKAMLVLKGNFTQKQIRALSDTWNNLQRGNITDCALPIINIPSDDYIGLLGIENGEIVFKTLFKD